MPKFSRLEIGVFVVFILAIVTVNAWYRVKYAGRVQQEINRQDAERAEAGAPSASASASASAAGAAPAASASAPSPAAAPR